MMASANKILLAVAFLVWSPLINATEITVEFDDSSTPPEEEKSLTGVERIFRNPALASGLASGAINLNRSINSLMEGLFYNLMDNELVFDVTESSSVNLGINRDVYEANEGTYVVVDRVGLGPRFGAPISSFYGLPITLGGQGTASVLDIYLRSDGQRYAEEVDIPVWRKWVNNWFGILPLLTAILPPSFNSNEMYDPLGELETPFLFPINSERALTMPVGNLRSYSISAVIHTGLDFLAKKATYFESELGESFDVRMPFKIFKEGEHRIGVLRRSDDVFWVGLSSADRLGAQLEGAISRVFYIFDKIAKGCCQVPAVILPVDVGFTNAKVLNYDLLFEFDFKRVDARLAFEKAVRGDFSLAEAMSRNEMTGVKFHFSRKAHGREKSGRVAQNIFVVRKSRDVFSSAMEVTTEDPSGRFYLLEGKSQTEDSSWDALVGPERYTYENRISIRVKKGEAGNLVYDASAPDAMNLILGLNISDRYVDSLEYRSYMERIRKFVRLPLKGVPDIPVRDEILEKRYHEKLFFMNPLKLAQQMSVTPTHLGRLDIDAAIYFSLETLKVIQGASDYDIALAFAKSFGYPDAFAFVLLDAKAFDSLWREIADYVVFPLKLAGLNIEDVGVVREYRLFLSTLRRLGNSEGPQDRMEAILQVLDTDYPAEIAEVLLALGGSEVPRAVTFKVKAKGKASAEIKDKFRSLNNKKFRSVAKLPPDNRYSAIREKLAKFNPRAMREWRIRPTISVLKLFTDSDHLLNLVLGIPKAQLGAPKVFLRIEQAGSVDVGRFVLFEGVVNLESRSMVKLSGGNSDKAYYQIRLNGEDGVAEGFIFDQAINLGGEFITAISVSHNGNLWSYDRQIKFGYQDGKIYKPKG